MTAARWRLAAWMGAALALALLVAGCGDHQNDDRGQSDLKMADITAVKVYRNIDNFPNIECVVIKGVAFATTSDRTGDSDANAHGVSLERVPQWDKGCP
jgi:hypothetical protein